MKSDRMLIAGAAALALSACVTNIPTGPEPAYAYSYDAPYYYVGPADAANGMAAPSAAVSAEGQGFESYPQL